MTTYWILFTLILIIHIFPALKKTEKTSNRKLIFSLIVLFIYGSIRVDFGRDYEAYENIFNNVKLYFSFFNNEDNFEIGYLLLNKITPSFRFLIILLSGLTCISYYFLFKKYVPYKYYWVGFLLMAIFGQMMVFFQFSGLRNAIAVNILTLSIPLIKERKIILFSLLTLLAFFFHNSAFFFLPLAYFIAIPTKFQKKELLFWVVSFLFFLIASTSSLLDIITPFVNIYFDRYTPYLDMVGTKKMSTFLLYGFVGIMFIMTLLILLKEQLSSDDNVILKLSLLFLLSFLLGALNFRMSQYFAPYFLVSTTIVLYRVKQPLLKYGYLCTVITYMLYAFFIVFMGMSDFPYVEIHTIFD